MLTSRYSCRSIASLFLPCSEISIKSFTSSLVSTFCCSEMLLTFAVSLSVNVCCAAAVTTVASSQRAVIVLTFLILLQIVLLSYGYTHHSYNDLLRPTFHSHALNFSIIFKTMRYNHCCTVFPKSYP